MSLLVNVLVFKLAWLSAVFSAAGGFPVAGFFVILAAVLIHLLTVDDSLPEIVLVAVTGAVGLAWDSVLVSAGWLIYSNGTIVSGLAPYWILGLWMLFATTLNISLRGLQDRPILAALLGAVFGPLSYVSGSAAGVVEIARFDAAIPALALAWALLLPGLLYVAGQLGGAHRFSVQASR